MSQEETEKWEQHRSDMRQMREKRRYQLLQVIPELRAKGVSVVEITPYQFRFDGKIDIYPSNKRYHDLRNNHRGDLRGIDIKGFLLHRLEVSGFRPFAAILTPEVEAKLKLKR